MIPKTIHCFWFSGERKPPLVERCIASWRKFAPDFEVREWDVGMLRKEFGELPAFAEEALKARKWAFASDWARFAVIERFGGVYLDMDVELVRPIDGLLSDGKGFFALNDDSSGWIDPGLGFAMPARSPAVAALVRRYEALVFSPECRLAQSCPAVANEILADFPEVRRLPARYFDPKGGCAGEVRTAEDTYAIHHYAASWFSWRQRLAYRILPRLGIDIHPLVMRLRRLRGGMPGTACWKGFWMILAACAFAWAAALSVAPSSDQNRVFYVRGADTFGDYRIPRACAALQLPYADTAVEAAPPKFDRCYPPLCLALVSAFPASRTGAAACTAVGALLLLAALTLLARSPWTLAAMMLSSVVLFAAERGQLVLYSAAAATVFLAWWNSGSRTKRIVAAVALSLAAVTKISPAVFGLMYLTRKDGWRRVEPWIAGVSALLLFAVPFAFYGGVGSFPDWMANAAANGAEYTRCGTWGTLALDRAMRVLRGLDIQTPWSSMRWFRMFDVALGLVCLWRGWRTASVFLIAAAMLLLPGNMLFYTGVYLLPAMLVDRGLLERAPKPLLAVALFFLLTPLQLPPFGVSRTLACVAFLALVAAALSGERRSIA